MAPVYVCKIPYIIDTVYIVVGPSGPNTAEME